VRLLIGLGLTGLVITALVVWLANLTDDKWFDDLWLEVAKASVQLLAVGVLGGALTYAWKDLSTQREKEAERRAKIRTELLDLFSLYNDVKSVRRSLRSMGLDPKYNTLTRQPAGASDGRFTEEKARAFHEQMLGLNSLQLGFESKKRQFEQTDFLLEDTGKVLTCLRGIEKHLNEVLKNSWEKRASTIQAGADIKPVSDALLPLLDTPQFKEHVSGPMTEITRLINKHVFGEASEKTKQLVKSWEEEEASD
jgi:hypothetical protein